MTITIDSLLPRPKLDYDVGYNVTVKGASVVVEVGRTRGGRRTSPQAESR
jgi:hypothetical protein